MSDQHDIKTKTEHRISGTPRLPGKKDNAILAAIKDYLLERVPQQEQQALRAEEAKIKELEANARQKDAEGERTLQEAAKIAKETDLKTEEVTAQRFRNIEDIFKDGVSAAEAKMKFATLMASDPELLKQIDLINSFIERLAEKHGTEVRFDRPISKSKVGEDKPSSDR